MAKSGIIHEAKAVLLDLKRMRGRMARQLDGLRAYDGWVLCKEGKKQTRHDYYDVIRPGAKRKTYLGSDRSEDVLNIKRLRYALKAVDVLDSNICLLENLIANYVAPDYGHINDLLPAAYQTDLAKAVTHSSTHDMPPEAAAWMEHLKTEKSKYPPYRPEQLKHPAMDGTMMRSKSEVIIANIMLLSGIPFVYEAPLLVDGKNILPDFTILSLIDLKSVIIIEHQGMVFVEEYADKFIRTLKTYLKTDWIPNETLFFTFDDARETLDPRQVISILRQHIKPSIQMPDFAHMAQS